MELHRDGPPEQIVGQLLTIGVELSVCGDELCVLLPQGLEPGPKLQEMLMLRRDDLLHYLATKAAGFH